ncbi:hypothetical protein F2Q69_00009860 [Brassica cretica]|uniref:Uncharacterized protein n=1 Tax=Brassica cretica TaxID=69181 RepID=A0A8S9NQG9_BRACR|nr:hypothetical protein F2Q69_00009860 [Brassica cretica]
MITFVAKLLTAFYAFVAAACSGSSSPSVTSDSRSVISPISTRVVSLASLVLLYYLLNDYSFDGV